MTIQFTAELLEAELQRRASGAAAMEACFGDGIAIYGAGFVGTWASRYLESLGARVSCFVDRDPRKHGTMLNGIPVVAPEAATLAPLPAMLIAARHAVRQVERELAGSGPAMMSFDGYFVMRNRERLLTVRDRYLDDERSVEVFNALLMTMLSGDLAPCRAVMEKDMYFCLPEFAGNFDETFVDAGAFVGDTVERFIWENLGTFRHIHAFEPGLKQFRAMSKRMERLAGEWAIDPDRVSLVRAGLSDRPGRMSCTFLDDAPLRHGLAELDATDAGEGDDTNARVITLDSHLDGRPVSFIKADVEGMEMELLRGAEQTIRKYRPKLAISAYHYPNHLFEIAEYIRTLVPEYRFRLRLHVPLFGDFVLYCSV
jgi:FkbM family methyltransferase